MGGMIYQQLSVNGIPFKYALIRTPVSFMLGASFQGMFFTTNRSWVADVILPMAKSSMALRPGWQQGAVYMEGWAFRWTTDSQ